MLAAHLGRARRDRRAAARSHRLTIDANCSGARIARRRARRAARTEASPSPSSSPTSQTGEILASVGSAGLFDERRDGFVDMTRAVRSPGSTLKPLIYGLAFELGLAHPETLIEDRPIDFAGYAPANFDRSSAAR